MLSLATLLFLGHASAGVLNAAHVIRRGESIEESMKRYVDSIVEPIDRRQSTPTLPSTGVNVTEWDAQTQAACTTSLESFKGVSSNPSGMAICYNLPYLDNSTGVFEADLRLYMIAAPTGDFANIASTNVQVGLSYDGATVSAVNASSLKKRSDATSLISWPRAVAKRATVPTMIQSYAFVGQVNPDLMSTNMGTDALQKVLIPTVTLTGVDGTGATVNTSLSSDEATFVSGVFAKSVAVTGTKAEVQAPIQTLVVQPGALFVVPGLNILIVPIGLIITSIWTVLFLGTIAYGTVGRMQFREQYRRRSARAEKGDLARI